MEFPHVQYETCLHPCWTGGCSQMFQLAVLVYHYPIIGQARAALVIFFCQSRGLIIEEFVAGQASSALLGV